MKPRTFPVVETFGPTVQGEGPDAGRRCVFVRFGGCDFQCSWCDSLHAVLPAEVRKAPRKTTEEIVSEIAALSKGMPTTVVFSGGNPVLHDLHELTDILQSQLYRVVVETQGSKWKDWLLLADLVVISPKPPSSGMTTDWNALESLHNNLWAEWDETRMALKVVVGDEADYDFAVTVHQRFPRVPFYVSVLNPDGSSDQFDIQGILDSYRDLCERIAADPRMEGVRAMPQLHTLAWGNAKGV